MMSFFEKAFLYGSLDLAARQGRAAPRNIRSSRRAMLFATSWAETRLAGRSGEITDAVIALLIGVILALMERRNRERAPRSVSNPRNPLQDRDGWVWLAALGSITAVRASRRASAAPCAPSMRYALMALSKTLILRRLVQRGLEGRAAPLRLHPAPAGCLKMAFRALLAAAVGLLAVPALRGSAAKRRPRPGTVVPQPDAAGHQHLVLLDFRLPDDRLPRRRRSLRGVDRRNLVSGAAGQDIAAYRQPDRPRGGVLDPAARDRVLCAGHRILTPGPLHPRSRSSPARRLLRARRARQIWRSIAAAARRPAARRGRIGRRIG